MKKIVISACLVGVKCRYNGQDSENENVVEKFGNQEYVLICPEQMGGLPTPRPAVEIVEGDGEDVLDGRARVVTADGEDKTDAMLQGAHHALAVAKQHGATCAVLKSKSPSCGCGRIYDGTFSGNMKAGDGVTAALFRRHGIDILVEDDLE
jgi:uncharacterized protein YbbK (DUF523 family)